MTLVVVSSFTTEDPYYEPSVAVGQCWSKQAHYWLVNGRMEVKHWTITIRQQER